MYTVSRPKRPQVPESTRKGHCLHVASNPRCPRGQRPASNRAIYALLRFNPRCPHGQRHSSAYTPLRKPMFQSTLPARAATRSVAARRSGRASFNPRCPHGQRPQCAIQNPKRQQFQSTLPARAATNRRPRIPSVRSRFNPRCPHGQRHVGARSREIARHVSIHAARTGSDHGHDLLHLAATVSIHAARTGSDALQLRRRNHNALGATSANLAASYLKC